MKISSSGMDIHPIQIATRTFCYPDNKFETPKENVLRRERALVPLSQFLASSARLRRIVALEGPSVLGLQDSERWAITIGSGQNAKGKDYKVAARNFNAVRMVGESSCVYLVCPFKIIPQVPLECASQIATSQNRSRSKDKQSHPPQWRGNLNISGWEIPKIATIFKW